ncbi:MAG: zinc ribbon domain-containing protein [Melioribacteraceae bacterium]
MPIFEYRCNDCGRKFEIFFKSVKDSENVKCPKCFSENINKLFSMFSSSAGSSSSENTQCCCGDNRNYADNSFCSSGMCNLND